MVAVKQFMKAVDRLFIFISLVFMVISCSDGTEIATQEIARNTGADELIHDLTMLSTIGDKTEWQMQSRYVERFTDERRWVAYEVFMETMNEADKNFYRSDSVYVNDIEDTFTGMGNVEIISPSGILETDLIIWNRRTDQIHAPNDVYLKRNQHEMWGADLYTNSNLDYVDMKRVRGHGTVDNEELRGRDVGNR